MKTNKRISINQVRKALRAAENAYRRYRRSFSDDAKRTDWKTAAETADRLRDLFVQQPPKVKP